MSVLATAGLTAGSLGAAGAAGASAGSVGILGSIGSALGSLPWGNIAATTAQGMSSLGGGLLSYSTDKKLMQKQYKYNLKLQQQAQAWQEYAYRNMHSWNVEGLRAAGLNPILSATSGQGSAMHSGQGSVSLPSSKFNMADLLSGLKFTEELNNLRTSTSAMKSQIGLNEGNTALSSATASKIRQEARIVAAEADFWSSPEGRRAFSRIQAVRGAPTNSQMIGTALNTVADNREILLNDVAAAIAGEEATTAAKYAHQPITQEDLKRAREELEARRAKERRRKQEKEKKFDVSDYWRSQYLRGGRFLFLSH